MNHLDTEQAEIANQQGWDDDTLLILALNHIDRNGLGESFTEYLRAVAREENGEENGS